MPKKFCLKAQALVFIDNLFFLVLFLTFKKLGWIIFVYAVFLLVSLKIIEATIATTTAKIKSNKMLKLK